MLQSLLAKVSLENLTSNSPIPDTPIPSTENCDSQPPEAVNVQPADIPSTDSTVPTEIRRKAMPRRTVGGAKRRARKPIKKRKVARKTKTKRKVATKKRRRPVQRRRK